MTKKIINQNSFTAGEVSPRIYSRSETDEYKRGVETATNCLITPHGTIKRRNGSQFIAQVKDNSKAVRLIPFQISSTVGYILEFGETYIRVYRDNAQITESTVTITGITQANPGVVTATAHGYSNGDQVYITSVAGMTEVNNTAIPYQVANKTTNTFELNDTEGNNVNTTSFTAYSSGGTAARIYTITSPWSESEVAELSFTASGSTMYIAHKDYAPRSLVRTSDTSWELDTITFIPPPTYEAGYDPNVSLKPFATTGTGINVLADHVDLTDGTYQWTASGADANEYYCELNGGGDPSLSNTTAVFENGSPITKATAGALSQSEWGLADNDSLGFTTIYVQLADDADPDSKSSGYLRCAQSATFLGADVGRQIINEATGETGRASITSIDSLGGYATVDIIDDFTDTNVIAAGDWKMDLSPIADLDFVGTQIGSIVNIICKYPSGTLGSALNISNITQANPGVVTHDSASFAAGDKVLISGVVGMVQVNENVYTVGSVTSTTLQLKDDNNTNVNTTNYTAYSSGGTVRQVFTDVALGTFRSADVGKYILINGGVLKIISVNSSTDIDCEVVKALNSSDTTSNWTLEEDTWSSTRGYPRAIGQYEQRLVFGGTSAQPQNLWLSESGIFTGFGTGPDDEDSIDVILGSNEVNEINWIATARDLVIGTSGGELTINSGTTSGLTPSSIQQQPRTYYGADLQTPAAVRDEILFIQNSGRKIRTFRYDFNIDGYTGEDLNFLAEHLTEGGLEEVSYAEEPDSVIYAVTTNGDMLAGTYDRSKRIIAWAKFTTNGNYENVETIGKGEEDQVWIVVNRTVNSLTKRYIEKFVPGDGSDDLHAFQDSFLTLSSNIAISGITAANPAVVTTSSAHGLSNNDVVIIKDLVDPDESTLNADNTNMSDLNQKTFTVANKTSTTFELTDSSGNNIDTSSYNAYGSSGNVWLKVTAVSGLGHLEGKSAVIRGDGATMANETVSSGAITIDEASGEVVAGLAYTTTIKTLGHEYDIGLGSMQGQRARWARPLIRVVKSTRPTLNGEYLPNRTTNDLLEQKIPLYTGFFEYGPLNWSNSTALTISLSDPLPLEVTGITGVIDAGVK